MGGTETWHTAGIDPEAVRQLRILARKMFGAAADAKKISICARQYQNQDLVFVGRGEDVQLFLRSEAVRKELGITDWTQRGYTARDRKSSYFTLFSQVMEVELGAWDEMIAMYRDGDARTLTTVQPLSQFKREKQLGEEIPDGRLSSGPVEAIPPKSLSIGGRCSHKSRPCLSTGSLQLMNSGLPQQSGIARLLTFNGQRGSAQPS